MNHWQNSDDSASISVAQLEQQVVGYKRERIIEAFDMYCD